jgi:hypothetical protein
MVGSDLGMGRVHGIVLLSVGRGSESRDSAPEQGPSAGAVSTGPVWREVVVAEDGAGSAREIVAWDELCWTSSSSVPPEGIGFPLGDTTLAVSSSEASGRRLSSQRRRATS